MNSITITPADSQFVTVTPGQRTYINQSVGQPGLGNLRYNPNYNQMEVYDGTVWTRLSQDYSIDLTTQVKEVINWAKNKMIEEQRWKALAESNPTFNDAYNNFIHAKEQLAIVETLIQK